MEIYTIIPPVVNTLQKKYKFHQSTPEYILVFHLFTVSTIAANNFNFIFFFDKLAL